MRNRFLSILQNDVKFQVRHGFYAAYLFVTVMYILLLSFLPEQSKAMLITIIVFSDPSALGFFFIGGIVLLEKGQSIYDHLFITPLTVQGYIVSKVLSLGFLSVLTSIIIHVVVLGIHQTTLLFIIGVLLTSIFFTIIGLGIAVQCKTLNGFFLIAPLYTILFCLPLLGYLGIYHTPLYYLLPTQASLLLLHSPFQTLEPWYAAGLILTISAWIGIAYIWTLHSFRKHIIYKIGG